MHTSQQHHQLVWVKIKGYPWWPCMIVGLDDVPDVLKQVSCNNECMCMCIDSKECMCMCPDSKGCVWGTADH